MANYTIELREITKNYNIFSEIKYPLYNENHKPDFEKKFIDYFFYREIAYETVGRFVHNLESILNIIHPYYEHLYKTMCHDYNPIENYNLIEKITEKNNISGVNSTNTNNKLTDTTTSTIESEGEEKSHDTPIKNTLTKYPSNVTTIDNTTRDKTDKNILNDVLVNGNSSSNSNKEHTRNTYGNIGVQTTQDMIKKERDIIINIDKLMFDELDKLFLQIW